jgi:hypothetical protein
MPKFLGVCLLDKSNDGRGVLQHIVMCDFYIGVVLCVLIVLNLVDGRLCIKDSQTLTAANPSFGCIQLNLCNFEGSFT